MTVTTRRHPRARCAIWALLISTVLAVLSPAIAHADPSACPAQTAALDANSEKIKEHNSRSLPGGVGPPEIVGPYNREADQLDGERAAIRDRLSQCETAVDKLRNNGPKPAPINSKIASDLGKATATALPQWTTPKAPEKRGQWIIIPTGHPLRPLWDAVKGLEIPMADFPSLPLQGAPPPAAGAEHASGIKVGTRKVKGETVPAVSADLIVPKAEILYLPRFLELSPVNMWEVLNAATNLQWVPTQIDAEHRNSPSAVDMQSVDDKWAREQVTLHDQKRAELTDLIGQLAESQKLP